MLNEISDFITYPRTFENYKWYKPILVIIVTVILGMLFNLIIAGILYFLYGTSIAAIFQSGEYEALNSEIGLIASLLSLAVMIPALYIASKIVKDRPFSSYLSTRGGWNFRLYFKALIIPLVCVVLTQLLLFFMGSQRGVYHFSLLLLVVAVIFVPLQTIAEECLFRGFLMQTLGSWFKIPVLALVIQAIIFALSHGYNSIGLTEIFISGLLFGFLTLKTDGIEVSSAFHTANNFTIFVFGMLGLGATTSSPVLSETVISIIAEILICALMYYVGKKTDWYGEIPQND